MTTKTEPHARPPAPRRLLPLAATLAAALASALAVSMSQAQPAAATALQGDAAASARSSAATGAAAARAIAERLQSLYPSTRFGPVHPTPWPGVFEVSMGANLAYVDESGRYFLFGHLYDMRVQRDLTAERREALARIDFRSLPLADALTEVRGTGSRVVAIFSDPDCPHCRRLEADLRDLGDVTIHTFLMPLAALHPASRGKAVAVWCASDRLAAWKALMLRNATPAPADCPHPVDRNVALGEQLGINGTPTLVAGDGRVLAGAASREKIDAWLSPASSGTSTGTGSGRQPAWSGTR